MSLWDRLTNFFWGSGATLEPRESDSAAESSVAVLEPDDAPATLACDPSDTLDIDDSLGELDAPNLWWMPEGEPVLTPPPPEQDQPHAQELREFLTDWVADPQIQLPNLPRVAQQALSMLRNNEVQFSKLADVVAHDAALAAEILRLVNSTAYARMFKVNSLEVAFARLGARPLRSLLTAASVKSLLPTRSGARGIEFWEHAVVSATLMEELSREDSSVSTDDAFLAGLLHDIGTLGLLKPVREFELARRVKISSELWHAVSDEMHANLGERMALEWKLPPPLPEVIGNHHAVVVEGDRCGRYRLLLQFADVFCSMQRYTPYVPYDFFNLPCVQQLGIRDDEAGREWLTSLSSLIMERTAVYVISSPEDRTAE